MREPVGSTQRRRVGKGGRGTSIDAPRWVRRAHAEQLNLPRDFAWARRQDRLCPPYSPDLSHHSGYFCDCLKYRKSGGGWFLRTGISMPSALMK